MATIKVFDSNGVRELKCFETLDMVDYLPVEFAEETDNPLTEDPQSPTE